MPKEHRLVLVLMTWFVASIGLAWPAVATEVVGGEPSPITLEVSTGQVVRFERPAGSIFVADPEVADVQVMAPNMVYVFGVSPGRTNLFAVDESDRIIANLYLTVELGVSEVNRSIDRMASGGTIRAEPAGNAMMLTGEAASPVDAADANLIAAAFMPDNPIIDRMAITGPNQVNLRVRFAEVSRSTMRELGINWQNLFRSGEFVFGLATGRNFLVGGTAISSGSSIFGSYTNLAQTVDVNVMLDALEEEGFISILAEPNLTAVSGQTASFLAGGEFPIPVPQDDGNITVEFKEFGVSLAFTPTILSDRRISLAVAPEVSDLSDSGSISIQGTTIPALVTRKAQTTVELASGQSFAIAGLFQRDMDDQHTTVPVLGDLPIIGPLFRSQRYRSQETELVIVVTPYLVEPVGNQRLALPTDPPNGLVDTPSVPPQMPEPMLAAAAAQPIRTAGGFILK